MRVGLVVPHIFMQRDILPRVIFSPGQLALDLANGLQDAGVEVMLFSPGPVDTSVKNVTADLSYFATELAGRGDSYLDLLKKHPFTFITLARQVQAELVAKAYEMANRDELDLVHVYTNEEELALPFAKLCTKPVVFTHHDPFNFLVKYRNLFPKYKNLNWISMSMAQRQGMPADTNWVSNIHHGLDAELFKLNLKPAGDYIAYLGRIIEAKGVHLAIAAAKQAGLKLKIGGKHYSGQKDVYWREQIMPHIDGHQVEYVGFISDTKAKQDFLGNAKALIVPSTFDEPFGMVMIESLACGTPIVGLDSGAIGEIIQDGKTGWLVPKARDEVTSAERLAKALQQIDSINRRICRADFEARFTLERMCQEHLAVYRKLIG